MFLAWNEISKNKLRFALITGVLFLISYLVFFLSGLADGLAGMNREAADKWDATGIVLAEEADKSMPQSILSLDDVQVDGAEETAAIGQVNAIASDGDEKQGVAFFGIDPDEFLMPDVKEGEPFSKENEVIASDALKDKGFTVGDELRLSSTDEVLTITGFTDKARFNAAPVLYGSLRTFQKIKFGPAAEGNEDKVNGIVFKAEDIGSVKPGSELEAIEMETFIRNLPGYSEQNLTLTFMIYFLLVISAVIIAIFLYVLTVQKISMFGVLKAQGISNGYLARSVVAQTFILAAVGVVLGFGLALLSGVFLPSAVPVAFDLLPMAFYGAIFIAVAVLGAVFSVMTIVKIDPLKAIGG